MMAQTFEPQIRGKGLEGPHPCPVLCIRRPVSVMSDIRRPVSVSVFVPLSMPSVPVIVVPNRWFYARARTNDGSSGTLEVISGVESAVLWSGSEGEVELGGAGISGGELCNGWVSVWN